MADQPERGVLTRLEREGILERLDADDGQSRSVLLPSAQPSVVGVLVSHAHPSGGARQPHRWAATGGQYRRAPSPFFEALNRLVFSPGPAGLPGSSPRGGCAGAN